MPGKNTSVDEWDSMIIRFSGKEHEIYFELSGECDT